MRLRLTKQIMGSSVHLTAKRVKDFLKSHNFSNDEDIKDFIERELKFKVCIENRKSNTFIAELTQGETGWNGELHIDKRLKDYKIIYMYFIAVLTGLEGSTGKIVTRYQEECTFNLRKKFFKPCGLPEVPQEMLAAAVEAFISSTELKDSFKTRLKHPLMIDPILVHQQVASQYKLDDRSLRTVLDVYLKCIY